MFCRKGTFNAVLIVAVMYMLLSGVVDLGLLSYYFFGTLRQFFWFEMAISGFYSNFHPLLLNDEIFSPS